MRKLSGTLLLAAAIFAAGCDNDIENAPGPTSPNPTTTETFTGSITANGAGTHPFAVSAGGTVTATITEVRPDAATQVGFVLGSWNASSNTCQTVLSRDNAVQGQSLSGSVSGVGTLCVRIHDQNGTLTGPINYTISVAHP